MVKTDYNKVAIYCVATELFAKHVRTMLPNDDDEVEIRWGPLINEFDMCASIIEESYLEGIRDCVRRALAGAEFDDQSSLEDRRFGRDIVRLFDEGVLSSIDEIQIVPWTYDGYTDSGAMDAFGDAHMVPNWVGVDWMYSEPLLECI